MSPEDEHEDDEVEIPPSLAQKWREDEKKGLRAGVCPGCGFTYDADALTCAHCERPVEFKEGGPLVAMRHFFTRTPMGVLLFLLLVLAIFLALV